MRQLVVTSSRRPTPRILCLKIFKEKWTNIGNSTHFPGFFNSLCLYLATFERLFSIVLPGESHYWKVFSIPLAADLGIKLRITGLISSRLVCRQWGQLEGGFFSTLLKYKLRTVFKAITRTTVLTRYNNNNKVFTLCLLDTWLIILTETQGLLTANTYNIFSC